MQRSSADPPVFARRRGISGPFLGFATVLLVASTGEAWVPACVPKGLAIHARPRLQLRGNPARARLRASKRNAVPSFLTTNAVQERVGEEKKAGLSESGWIRALCVATEEMFKAREGMLRAGSAWGRRVLANCRRYASVSTSSLLSHLPRAPLPRSHCNQVLSAGAGYDEQGSSVVVRHRAQVVGEAWKVLSKAYVDKTFNGQDWNAVRKEYVKATYKSTEEAYAAIRKMAATLGDKYTRFLTPSQYNTLASMYTNDQPTAGVGVEIILDPAKNALTVLGTIPGSPAEKSGIQKGDVIVGVDAVKMGDYGQTPTPDDAAALLRGVPGTQVTVKIKGMFGEKAVTLTREVLKGRLSSGKLVEIGISKVGVIKVLSFNQGTSHEVVELGLDLIEKGASGLVLDLRGNVGGFFPAAVELGRELLEQDMTIVTVVDNKKETSSYRTEVTGTLSVHPLVVLVDKNTASAAEVLAAALKENGRAKVVGEPTFGKGLIQTIARLADGSALVVTVAQYRTPLNNDINKVGIQPDFAITCAKDEDLSCIPEQAFTKPAASVAIRQ